MIKITDVAISLSWEEVTKAVVRYVRCNCDPNIPSDAHLVLNEKEFLLVCDSKVKKGNDNGQDSDKTSGEDIEDYGPEV